MRHSLHSLAPQPEEAAKMAELNTLLAKSVKFKEILILILSAIWYYIPRFSLFLFLSLLMLFLFLILICISVVFLFYELLNIKYFILYMSSFYIILIFSPSTVAFSFCSFDLSCSILKKENFIKN